MEKSNEPSPSAFTQSNFRMSSTSESQQQVAEAALRLPTYVQYGYGDSAIILHCQVLELREDYRCDIITSLLASDANLNIANI